MIWEPPHNTYGCRAVVALTHPEEKGAKGAALINSLRVVGYVPVTWKLYSFSFPLERWSRNQSTYPAFRNSVSCLPYQLPDVICIKTQTLNNV